MQHPPDFKKERRAYLVGFVIALGLTLLPFWAVAAPWASRSLIIWAIAVCAVIQILAQFRYFLHINLSRQKREDLQLILFATLIVIIMMAGTIWIMANLAMRMM
ncbi:MULTISPECIES: cytochrome o ubiquinol oxidase subunit IV [unclassified Meridianimarinicoccus]|uniref:cytochrome o ubiquinol oxidase subunit IV n=1 Tax=unclassified Meridianimarinicoccus TaxID=2923344 RepID=UPI001866D251|nr:cytochrome o ubiquinol oxidase subunit IV [Fluviibacterium sp. MJW13]